MDKVLIVDNQRFEKIHVASLSRGFEVLDGENAGRVKTGDMIRDIIGTYYNYTLTLEPDGSQESIAEYDQLYEIISVKRDNFFESIQKFRELLKNGKTFVVEQIISELSVYRNNIDTFYIAHICHLYLFQ